MNKYIYCLLLSFVTTIETDAENIPSRLTNTTNIPKLVVNIAIDQLQHDLLDEYMSLYENEGFRKLLSNGCIYYNASVPFFPVDRASSIASLSTGATPVYNGIPSCEWISRSSLRPMYCTADQISLLTPRNITPTPVNMMASTLSDELKISTNGAAKVFNIATTSEAAILFAGYTSDCAMWIDINTGEWITSSYYNESLPTWINEYNKLHNAASKLKSKIYTFKGREKYIGYTTTSLANNDVTNITLSCIIAESLGVDNITDLINIQYTLGNIKNDVVCSVDDVLKYQYVELDKTLGKLISAIERTVGKENVLFAITSTGYFDEPQIDYSKYKIPSGTVYINRTSSLLNMYLSALYGNAHYVDAYKDNQIYLNHKLIEQRRLPINEVLARSRELLLMSEGISDVYTSFMLTSSTDYKSQLLKNGYNIDVCGDLIIEPDPGWNIYNENTNKYTKNFKSGFSFPIILYGADIKHEIKYERVTIDQIAPTLSKKIKIRAPNACKVNSLKINTNLR